MTTSATDSLAARMAVARYDQMGCPACASDDFRPLLVGDRHDLGLVFVHCNDCGLVYLAPRPDAEWFADFYANAYWRHYLVGDLEEQFRVAVGRGAEMVAAVLPAMPRSPVSFLDVGCGPGGLLSVLKARHGAEIVCGTEPSADSRQWCSTQGIDRVYPSLEAVTTTGLRFDLITLCHVLEHTTDPVRELAALRNLLTPDGRLYIEVPDIRSPHWHGFGFFHIAHVLNFDEPSLRHALSRAGLMAETVFHGVVKDWPWAVGVLARRSDGPTGAAVPPDYRSLAEHIGRGVRQVSPATADHEPQSSKPFSPARGLILLRQAFTRAFGLGRLLAPARRDGVKHIGTPNTVPTHPALRVGSVPADRADDSQAEWLHHNRAERMDIASDIFDAGRRRFHAYRYRFATSFCRGRRVADIACGTGYGTKMLAAAGATAVIGIDIDPDTVAYAARVYGGESIRYQCAPGDATGLADHSLDLVVSFETVEHVPSDQSLLQEFARTLMPGGLLIISTPNEWPIEASPHHVRTYDRAAFECALGGHFIVEAMYNQNSGGGSPYNHGQPAGIVPTTPANDGLAECLIAIARKPM